MRPDHDKKSELQMSDSNCRSINDFYISLSKYLMRGAAGHSQNFEPYNG